MADSNDLLPEEGDEQHQRLISDLRLMYNTDGQKAQHLAQIQQRLLHADVSLPVPPGHVIPPIQHSSKNVKPTRSAVLTGRPWQRRLSMIAAVVVVVVLVGSFLLVLNRTRHPGGGAAVKPTGGLTTVRSLHMIDATRGWALTETAVLLTTDGGAHWKNVTPPGTTLTRDSIADFRTASLATIATQQPNAATTQVLHTADGGQSWQRATIHIPFARHISFIDAQHGWLLGAVRSPGGAAEPVSVFRTIDGGKTWVSVATALFGDTTPPGHLPYGGQKSGMTFLNAATGWVTGTVTLPNLAWLYVTHDGGATWRQQSLSMPPGVPSARLTILSPTFFSEADGILPVIFSTALTDKDVATAIYTTHDGGLTWQSTAPLVHAPRLFSFADQQHGWATNGTLLSRTADGGNQWSTLSPNGSFKNITQLDFVSATVGWAISSTAPTSSSLLKTVDGGQTWAIFSSPVA